MYLIRTSLFYQVFSIFYEQCKLTDTQKGFVRACPVDLFPYFLILSLDIINDEVGRLCLVQKVKKMMNLQIYRWSVTTTTDLELGTLQVQRKE